MAQYIKGNWSDKFFNHFVLLRGNIANLNVTRISLLYLDAKFLGKGRTILRDCLSPHGKPLYTVMGRIAILIIILSVLHSVFPGSAPGKLTLQVLMVF